MIVNLNNCHETIINYIEENEISVTNYDDIKNVYADMISKHFYFVIDRDLISDILIDLTYALSTTAINRGRVIATIEMEEEDDGNFSE